MSTSTLEALYRQERARLLQCQDWSGELASPVFGEGALAPQVLLIGEAPGATETKLARPFVGRAGQQLDQLLQHAGIAREDIFITNVVKYRPTVQTERSTRNRTPSRSEILQSLPLLRKEILCLKPRMIVTLGNVPLFAICKLCEQEPLLISDVHGIARWVQIDACKFTLYPMYHPASVLYRRSLASTCENDAVNMGKILQEAVNFS